MKVLYIAEIVGRAGIYAFKKGIDILKRETGADFVIACADTATGGNGVGRNHAAYIRKLGADILTTGDFCFHKKDLVDNFETIPYVLRPENLKGEAPGRGFRIYKLTDSEYGPKVAVAVLLGQSGFNRLHSDNPYTALSLLLERLREETPFIIIDFHAEATAEKRMLFYLADGLCSAVIGSHSRVQTADEQVLERGTAIITDAGRTGAVMSVGGCDKTDRLQEYLTGIHVWARETWDTLEIQGVIIDINDDGKARSIRRLRMPVQVDSQPESEWMYMRKRRKKRKPEQEELGEGPAEAEEKINA